MSVQGDDVGILAKWGAAILGAIAAVAASLFGMQMKGIHARIKRVEDAMEHKVDHAELLRVRDAQAKLFDQMRDDNQRVMGAIGDLTGSFHDFTTKVTEELGKRPTREELHNRD